MCRSRSIKAIDVFVGFLDLFWTKETVREGLGPEVLYLLLYAFILFMVNRNAIFDIFIFIASTNVHVWSVACLIFIASANVHVWSVACLRLVEIREHHSWCFMFYFVA
jgi:hypothetical protein